MVQQKRKSKLKKVHAAKKKARTAKLLRRHAPKALWHLDRDRGERAGRRLDSVLHPQRARAFRRDGGSAGRNRGVREIEDRLLVEDAVETACAVAAQSSSASRKRSLAG